MYFNIHMTEFHGPDELTSRFRISKRTLHRDLDDLRDSGLLYLEYDKKHDNYVITDEDKRSKAKHKSTSNGDNRNSETKRNTGKAEKKADKKNRKKNNKNSVRRLQHLKRLHRLGTLIFSLTPTDMDAVSGFYSGMEEFDFYIEELMNNGTLDHSPEEIPEKPVPPELDDLKAEYYSLFPDSSERTRQRDFETLNRAGFPIRYDRRIGKYIYEPYDE